MRPVLYRCLYASGVLSFLLEATLAYRLGGYHRLFAIAVAVVLLAALVRWFSESLSAMATTVLALAVFSLLTIGILPHSGSYRTITVLSDSMQPAFSSYDVLIVERTPVTSLRVGDVITYAIPVGDRRVETHRIVELEAKDGKVLVQTKGDANQARDPWVAELQGTDAWRTRAVVPAVGRVLLFLRQPLIQQLVLYVTPALLALLALWRLWVPRPRASSHA